MRFMGHSQQFFEGDFLYGRQKLGSVLGFSSQN